MKKVTLVNWNLLIIKIHLVIARKSTFSTENAIRGDVILLKSFMPIQEVYYEPD